MSRELVWTMMMLPPSQGLQATYDTLCHPIEDSDITLDHRGGGALGQRPPCKGPKDCFPWSINQPINGYIIDCTIYFGCGQVLDRKHLLVCKSYVGVYLLLIFAPPFYLNEISKYVRARVVSHYVLCTLHSLSVLPSSLLLSKLFLWKWQFIFQVHVWTLCFTLLTLVCNDKLTLRIPITVGLRG